MACQMAMWVKDHPRSRGVYPIRVIEPISSTGSSPLARGLLASVWREDTVDGIIPARAGFTATLDIAPTEIQDHPRSRGVYMRRTAST